MAFCCPRPSVRRPRQALPASAPWPLQLSSAPSLPRPVSPGASDRGWGRQGPVPGSVSEFAAPGQRPLARPPRAGASLQPHPHPWTRTSAHLQVGDARQHVPGRSAEGPTGPGPRTPRPLPASAVTPPWAGLWALSALGAPGRGRPALCPQEPAQWTPGVACTVPVRARPWQAAPKAPPVPSRASCHGDLPRGLTTHCHCGGQEAGARRGRQQRRSCRAGATPPARGMSTGPSPFVPGCKNASNVLGSGTEGPGLSPQRPLPAWAAGQRQSGERVWLLRVTPRLGPG